MCIAWNCISAATTYIKFWACCAWESDSLVAGGAERASQLSSHRILTRMYMYFRLQNINHGVISNIIENDDRSVKINGSKSYQRSVRKFVVSFHALIMYQVNWWVDTVINTLDYKCNTVIKICCVFFLFVPFLACRMYTFVPVCKSRSKNQLWGWSLCIQHWRSWIL